MTRASTTRARIHLGPRCRARTDRNDLKRTVVIMSSAGSTLTASGMSSHGPTLGLSIAKIVAIGPPAAVVNGKIERVERKEN